MDTAVRSTLLGAGIGAGLMFLLDPGRGARRRALIRDKAVRAMHKSRDAYDATRRDLGNRINGVTAMVRGRFSSDAADDVTVRERVRAELGRVASHPRAIQVTASNGCVTLSGDVLASEAAAIVSAISGVRGVQTVENCLAVRASAENVPSLQGESERPGWWSTWLRRSWSPAAMVVAGAGAVAATAAAVGAARRAG